VSGWSLRDTARKVRVIVLPPARWREARWTHAPACRVGDQ
jgi:hypothetical protein